MSAASQAEWDRQQIRLNDEARFEQRVARASQTKVHKMIPHHWFDKASSECRDIFIDGHFTGCVSLCQSVAEGLVKFLVKLHPVGKDEDLTRAERLRNAGVISDECCQAFLRIRGEDRNHFHHLNEEIITDEVKLEERAEECIEGLYRIESEIFAFDISNDGAIVPSNLQYWPKQEGPYLTVFLRMNG